MIPIWFFIGISLLVNGLLILGAGIYEYIHPPTNPSVQLFQLHANAWWGALMTIVGSLYCYFFPPKRTKTK
ncbi:MAG TPA: hypothetical protein VE077_13365 [Candidatus Methylomirabilis sp.]|nr:hypothetical protein [Candidatus Methylomirabilis sp.]